MLKRPHYIALVTVVLLVLILLKLPSETVAKFKLTVGGFFLPLFGVTSSAQQVVNKTGNAILPRSELTHQNELLRQENQQLKILAQQAEEISRDNAQLRQLVGWQKQVPWKLRLARVISRDPANWWRTVQIDLGTRDGVQVNFPVLTVDGLVGRVSAVTASRSTVVLMGDPNLRVGAVIVETMSSANGRETGVITANGSAPLENNMITLSYLSGNSSVKPGQTVMTSGEGGVFPRGIPIGKIVDLRSVDYGLSTEARVSLFAKMNAIEEVSVMFPEGVPSGNLGNQRTDVRPANTGRPQIRR